MFMQLCPLAKAIEQVLRTIDLNEILLQSYSDELLQLSDSSSNGNLKRETPLLRVRFISETLSVRVE